MSVKNITKRHRFQRGGRRIGNRITRKIFMGGVNTNPLEKISDKVAGDFIDAEKVLKPSSKHKRKNYTKGRAQCRFE